MSRKKIKTCVRCGVRGEDFMAQTWGGETYHYCFRCKEVAKLLKKQRAKKSKTKTSAKKLKKKKCEGCGGAVRKDFKLCRDCYWRSKAAQGALEQALNKKMAQETDS